MDRDLEGLADKLFFSKEAADYLGISVQRLAMLTKEGAVVPLKKNQDKLDSCWHQIMVSF